MSYDLSVLRALVRLVRVGKAPEPDALALALMSRAGGSHDDVCAALARLVRDGLVDRTPRRVTPTLAGLCVAIASGAARRRRAKPLGRRLPAARRHAA